MSYLIMSMTTASTKTSDARSSCRKRRANSNRGHFAAPSNSADFSDLRWGTSRGEERVEKHLRCGGSHHGSHSGKRNLRNNPLQPEAQSKNLRYFNLELARTFSLLSVPSGCSLFLFPVTCSRLFPVFAVRFV